MALILGNFSCVSRPFRIVSGVTLNANIKIEGMGVGAYSLICRNSLRQAVF